MRKLRCFGEDKLAQFVIGKGYGQKWLKEFLFNQRLKLARLDK